MIYDCFTFFNELDLLEIRLRTLSEVVDRFVLAESRYTHTGKPKPLYYQANAARFQDFADRIIHVIAPDPTDLECDANDQRPSWIRENAQRNATIDRIRARLKDDDLLIVSDLDEIPTPQAVLAARKSACPVCFRQKMYYYFANYRNCTSPYWYGSVALTYRAFKDPCTYSHLETGIAFPSAQVAAPSTSKVRALRKLKVLRNGGWHFSYLGGISKIREKLGCIVDGGMAGNVSDEFIAGCIANGKDIFRRGERYFAEKTDTGFPEAFANFPQLVYPVGSDYLRRVRVKRWLACAKWLIRPIAWRILPRPFALWLSRMTNR